MKIKNNTLSILIGLLCGVFLTNPINADQIAEVIKNNTVAESSNKSYPKSSESSNTVESNELTQTSDNTDGNDDAIGEILIQAMSLMGISYKWGGNTPETGMDCSGFIRYVFKKAMGVNLPRTANEMSKVGIRVSPDNMKLGDLIFFNTIGGRRNSHVGMYIGDNQFIQSPSTGEKIQITAYNSYWRSHTNGVKRIVADNTDASGRVETYVNVKNQALPSGYIKGKYKKHRSRVGVRRTHKSNTVSHRKSSKSKKTTAKKRR